MKFVLDSSIWVKAFKAPLAGCEPNEENQAEAVALCDDIAACRHQILMPSTTLTEIVGAHARQFPPGTLAERLRDWVMRLTAVSVIAVDEEFAFKAGICARLFKLKGMDAIVAYAAIAHGYDLVASDAALLSIPNVLSGLTDKECGTNWAIDICAEARNMAVLGLAGYPWACP